MYKVSVKFVLNKYQKRKDGTHPIQIQVIYKQKKRLYRTGLACTESEWSNIISENPKKDYKPLQGYLKRLETHAIAIAEDLHPFSFDKFKERYLGLELKKVEGFLTTQKNKSPQA